MIAGVLNPMKFVATSAASWARFSAITGGGTTPARAASNAAAAAAAPANAAGTALGSQLESIERDAIIKALEKTRYNKTAAAKLLGLSFRALRYRIKKLGIE